jgi:hypothetical protein
MNILLWVLQVLAALLYGSSGVMKVFMFEERRTIGPRGRRAGRSRRAAGSDTSCRRPGCGRRIAGGGGA